MTRDGAIEDALGILLGPTFKTWKKTFYEKLESAGYAIVEAAAQVPEDEEMWDAIRSCLVVELGEPRRTNCARLALDAINAELLRRRGT